jgi:iron(III) transport system substrate-binding protein
VLVYNQDEVGEADLPDSVFDLTDPAYAGQVAVAPTNGSFIDFVSGLRQIVGDARTEEWLAGMARNDSPNYANNNAILEAVARGEVPLGLANHYYLERAKVEDPDIAAANHFFAQGDPGSMLLVAAAGITATSERVDQAQQLVAFLLSEESQTYFAEETFEYPLAAGVAPAGDLPPLADLPVTRLDLDELGDQLSSTLDMIRESGIQQ